MDTEEMIEITNAQSAAIVSAMHVSLGLPLTQSDEIEKMRLQAYVEIISYPSRAADTLALGEAVDSIILLTRKDDLLIDPTAIIEVHGNRTVRLALTYAGVTPRQHAAKTVWTVGIPRPNGQVLKLPESILCDWLA